MCQVRVTSDTRLTTPLYDKRYLNFQAIINNYFYFKYITDPNTRSIIVTIVRRQQYVFVWLPALTS